MKTAFFEEDRVGLLLVILAMLLFFASFIGLLSPGVFRNRKTGVVPHRFKLFGLLTLSWVVLLVVGSILIPDLGEEIDNLPFLADQNEPAPAAVAGKPAVLEVTRKDFGSAWPFVEESATLSCARAGVPVAKIGRIEYALTSAGDDLGYAEIEQNSPVLRFNPRSPSTKMSFTNIQKAGETLCEGITETVESPVTEEESRNVDGGGVNRPAHFSSVADMIESLNDFSEKNATFKVISSDPLHIQLLKVTREGDSPVVRLKRGEINLRRSL